MLAIKYTLFAIIATIANLASQEAAVTFYQGHYSLAVAIIVGTGIGLLTKYYLDKWYIFSYQTKNLADDVKKFYLYTCMGVITTVVFWLFEWGFDAYGDGDKTYRYTGAVLGLAIGYVIKYNLDKRFVFKVSQ